MFTTQLLFKEKHPITGSFTSEIINCIRTNMDSRTLNVVVASPNNGEDVYTYNLDMLFSFEQLGDYLEK